MERCWAQRPEKSKDLDHNRDFQPKLLLNHTPKPARIMVTPEGVAKVFDSG
jgi:hypothetical protein